jgi:7-carboxy-7-deazaguanine synthase
MLLPVNEVFATVQGEGHHAGTAAVFIRLQGCGVGCPWCDTKHTWELNEDDAVPIDEVLKKTGSSGSWAWMPHHEIVAAVLMLAPIQHVVITGGEPCDQDLRELTASLVRAGIMPQIETSGTAQVLCHPDTWVTVSPKIGMPGRKRVLDEALARADEIKMPVGKQSDLATLTALLRPDGPVRLNAKVFLQPLSRSERATQLCVDTVKAHPRWRLSVQIHAYLNIR